MPNQTSSSGGTDHDLASGDLAGKYLTFRIGKEEYGLEILRVREIIELMDITPVPRTPDSIRGVINLRGRIIPVLHLRVKFEMELVEDTDETCIIVVDMDTAGTATQMAILVDGVREVVDISSEEIEPAPSFGGSVDSRFILAMAKLKGGVKVLLNTEQILNTEEFHVLRKPPESDHQAA